jgi:hypothetical protein
MLFSSVTVLTQIPEVSGGGPESGIPVSENTAEEQFEGRRIDYANHVGRYTAFSL